MKADFPQRPYPDPLSQRVECLLATIGQVSNTLGLSVPPIVDIDELRSRPLGSFGRTWADTLDRHHLKPLNQGPRRQQLHDGIHVLTGYGTDPVGEAEVQAFILGAKFRWFNLAIAVGLLGPIIQHLRQGRLNLSPPEIGTRLWRAYQRGWQSYFNPDTWEPEKLWDLTLADVQKVFGV